MGKHPIIQGPKSDKSDGDHFQEITRSQEKSDGDNFSRKTKYSSGIRQSGKLSYIYLTILNKLNPFECSQKKKNPASLFH